MRPIENQNFLLRTQCPICGSPDGNKLISQDLTEPKLLEYLVERYHGIFDKADLSGALYEVKECSTCTFWYQTYLQRESFLKKTYSLPDWQAAESVEKKLKAPLSFFIYYSREIEKIARLFTRNPYQIRVLDFGSGWGLWTQMARAYGYEAHGFEITQQRVDYSRKSGLNIFDTESALEGKKFDYIYSDQVFEHIADPLRSMKLLEQALSEGGIAHIIVPNVQGVKHQLQSNTGNPLKIMHPFEHINGFTHASLQLLAGKAGLRPISSQKIARKLIKNITLTQNLHYLQESLKCFYTQNTSTSVYFEKTPRPNV